MASTASSNPSVAATNGAPLSPHEANAFTSAGFGSKTMGTVATRCWYSGVRLATSSRATARTSAWHAAGPRSGPSNGREDPGAGACGEGAGCAYAGAGAGAYVGAGA